jgi:hypothetical protein
VTPPVISAALEGIARNREQHRIAFDPDNEINSLVEHIREIARTATPEQRPHVHALFRLIRDLCESNHAELRCERFIAAAADAMADPGWTVKRAARELRDPLAVLCNPIIGEQAKERAREDVRRVVRLCPRDLLVLGDDVRPSLVNEIRTRKATALWPFLCEPQAVPAC